MPARPLPIPLTTFVGREVELAQLAARLSDPACRLLTLLGLGGSGKTRLALELARSRGGVFADGAAFVDLQPVTDPDAVSLAIADALGLTLTGHEPAERQLHTALAQREMLIVLDNFEHLLSAAMLLDGLLAAASRLRLLVTSREALNLQQECLYPLHGLPYPRQMEASDPLQYGAVELFVSRAQRVQPDFSLGWDAESVLDICRLVEGLPLAIELAASWIKTLSPRAISGEIQHGLEFLATGVRNVAERHRSLRAVFDQSWRMLTQHEQQVFRRLAVFRGRFDRSTAAEVAGATLADLNALVDKSLLRHTPDDRYHIHELLRQYAERRLEDDPQEAAQTRAAHRHAYTMFLARRVDELTGPRQRQALREIAENLENIRAAWHEIIAGKHLDDLLEAVYPLSNFYDQQGRYLESITMFEQATALLRAADLDMRGRQVLVLTLVGRGASCLRLGKLSEARRYYEQAIAVVREQHVEVPSGFATDPWVVLAHLETTEGRHEEAIRLASEVRDAVMARGDRLNLLIVDYTLARAAFSLGDYDAAGEHAARAYEETREAGNMWMMAYMLATQGDIAVARGAYQQAAEFYQASYDTKEAFDDPEGMAVALIGLGRVALLQGEPEQAMRCFERSRTIYEPINDAGGLATSLHGLGDAAAALGRPEDALAQYLRALTIAQRMQWQPLMLSILVSVGELLAALSNVSLAGQLLTLVRRHPASSHLIREQAAQALAQLPGLHVDALPSLEEAVGVLLTPGFAPGRPTPRPASLPVPLTPRELEVLRLLAAGLSNPAIADRLVISVGTVKSYTNQIYDKLQVSNRTQAVLRAREVGLVP